MTDTSLSLVEREWRRDVTYKTVPLVYSFVGKGCLSFLGVFSPRPSLKDLVPTFLLRMKIISLFPSKDGPSYYYPKTSQMSSTF